MIFPGAGTGGPMMTSDERQHRTARQRLDPRRVLRQCIVNLADLRQPLVVEIEPGAKRHVGRGVHGDGKVEHRLSPGSSAPARGADVGAVRGSKGDQSHRPRSRSSGL